MFYVFPKNLYSSGIHLKITEFVVNYSRIAIYFVICISICILIVSGKSWALSPKEKFYSAESCYKDLISSQEKQKSRHNWLMCIGLFQDVYTANPSGSWAAAGLYRSGQLYDELFGHSGLGSDQTEALDLFERIILRFPSSKYYTKAVDAIRNIKEKEYKADIPHKIKKTADKSTGDYMRAESVDDDEKATKDSPVNVMGLRYWSNPNYTRLVIDADKETDFTHQLLDKDNEANKPKRLYVDLSNSRIGPDLKKVIPINDNLLSDARAGQFTLDTVRVVVDIKSFNRYNIFSLKNPFRIVLDVWSQEGKEKVEKKDTQKPVNQKATKSVAGSLAKQLALNVSKIIIDPGHGGKDYGAPGYIKGVHEKNIVLSIAKRLAKEVKEKIGCEVIMTRSKDEYLTLEERTALANTHNADLFISIHTNAARDQRAYGIETYFLNLATDEESILVAARENATSKKNISDIQTILNELMQNAKIYESSKLANMVQDTLVDHLKSQYSNIKSKGVKQAPFYVLLGAQMPSILIETSFISNAKECKRLSSDSYQEHLCEGIVKGIQKYIASVQPKQ